MILTVSRLIHRRHMIDIDINLHHRLVFYDIGMTFLMILFKYILVTILELEVMFNLIHLILVDRELLRVL